MPDLTFSCCLVSNTVCHAHHGSLEITTILCYDYAHPAVLSEVHGDSYDAQVCVSDLAPLSCSSFIICRAGNSGASGLTGATGVSGFTGFTGLTGSSGVTGATGMAY